MDWEPSRNDNTFEDIFDRFSESINRLGVRTRHPAGRRPTGGRRSGFRLRREENMRRDFLRLENLRMRLRGNN